jgi:ribosomal-protein-alanine N-acetyltransferase
MLLDLGDLCVRSWCKADLAALLRHANNPKVANNLRDQFPHPYTRHDGIDFLDYARTQDPECSFAIEYGGEVLGGVGFHMGRDISRISAEMGYWLGEDFWGKGLATRAVTAMSEWAFESYKLTRVYAFVFSHNVGSIRVLEKSGFEREGLLRRSAIKNGVVIDQFLFAKVR